MDTLTLARVETQFEVIGCGEIPVRPVQVGDWWVVPADQYDSTIPSEAMRKAYTLINQGVKIKGILVADDIKKKEFKEKQEEEKKEIALAFSGTLLTILTVLGTIALGLVYLFVAALAYDPMLVAVLEDGRWVCLHSWYD